MAQLALDIYRDWDLEEHPTQLAFFNSHARNRLFSSGVGAGKSASGCIETIRHAILYADGRHLVGRYKHVDLTRSTMVTFFAQLRRIGLVGGSQRQMEAGKAHFVYRAQQSEIEFWNGSIVMFVNLDDPTGSKYGSLELNTAFIDEGSEVPSQVLQTIINERVGRWAGSECPNRTWVCTNPGPSKFLKDIISGTKITPGVEQKSTVPEWTVFRVPRGENTMHADPEYNARILRTNEQIGAHSVARWVDGDWDSFEGQRFTMFNRKDHILDIDFQVNDKLDAWDVYEGWDFGWRNPTAIPWIAVHRKGHYPPIVFDEAEFTETEPKDIAAAVKAKRAGMGLKEPPIAMGDPAGNAKNMQGVSVIMEYALNHGIEITPCFIGKMPEVRADLIARLLSTDKQTPDGHMKGLMFSPRCRRMIDSITEYRYKENTSDEDAPEKFVKSNDHFVDALGYALIYIATSAQPEEDDTARHLNQGAHPTPRDIFRQQQERQRALQEEAA